MAKNIALILGLFEFYNAAKLCSQNYGEGAALGSILPKDRFATDLPFKFLFIAAILWLGIQRLSYAFSEDTPPSKPNSKSNSSLASPWFCNVLAHAVECCLWYALKINDTRKSASDIFIAAATFAGHPEAAAEDFVLLVLVPLLTVYFYTSRASHC